MGISFLAWTSSRWKSSPLIPGNLMSRTRQLATSGRLLRMNSVADPNSSTCKPTDSTRRLMARRTEGSSSTTKTMEAGSVIYRHRQKEFEQRALGTRGEGQVSSMRLDYGMADCQPHSDAFRLRGKEWFKDTVGQMRLNSWSRVLNLDQHPICASCRPEQKLPWSFRRQSHGFNGVHDEINQHLLQLHLVAGHAREIRCEVDAQGDMASRQLGAQQNPYVLNDPVNVQSRSSESALHQQPANPGNDRARPRSIAHNLCNCCT